MQIYDPAERTTRANALAIAAVGSFAWTPDGRGIAYLAVDPGAEPDPIVAERDYRYARLYIQPLSGGEPRRVTTADRHVVSFALSPDGTRAVYAAQPTPRNRDSFDVRSVRSDLRTLAERPLVVQPGRDADPSYSPDGQWIAFHSQGGTLNYFAARQVRSDALRAAARSAISPRDPDTSYRRLPRRHFFAWSRDGKRCITRPATARGICWCGRIWRAAGSKA